MRKSIARFLIVIFIVCLISGCSQQGTATEQPVIGIIASEDMPVLTQDSGPAQGGRLSLFITQPVTLNPLYTDDPYLRLMSQFIFDALYMTEEGKEPRAFLAQEMKTYDNPLIVDIMLQEATLHNGETLSASDVAFTIEAIKKAKSKSPYYANVVNIESVKAIDKRSFRLVLIKADDKLAEKLTFPILPESVFKDWPSEGIDPDVRLIGSGAYRMDSFDGSILSVSRFDGWWYESHLGHPVWMDGIDFKIYENEDDMIQAFNKNEVDVAVVHEGDLEAYSKRTDIQVNRFMGDRLEYILLSNLGAENNRMADQEFREILLKYLKWYITLNPIEGSNAGSSQLIAHGGAEIMTTQEEVLEKLTALGMLYDEKNKNFYYYKNGSKLPFTLRVRYNSLDIDRLKTGEWLQKAMMNIGIQVVLDKSSQKDEKTLINSKKFDIMLLGCRIPLTLDLQETLDLVVQSFGYPDNQAVILPIYRKNHAVLYNSKIKGPRLADWKNIYNGWTDWYLVQSGKNPDE
jgi:peptide/nickel transport system substrate-binding protein